MFDKAKMLRISVTLLVSSLVCAGMLGSFQMALIFLTIAGTVEALRQAIRPPLPRITRGLFESGQAVSQLKEHVEEDPELRSVLEYLYGLSPTDFMRTVRLAVELRDEGSQRALKDASSYFRKNKE